jgi:hypothetical protein
MRNARSGEDARKDSRAKPINRRPNDPKRPFEKLTCKSQGWKLRMPLRISPKPIDDDALSIGRSRTGKKMSKLKKSEKRKQRKEKANEKAAGEA